MSFSFWKRRNRDRGKKRKEKFRFAWAFFFNVVSLVRRLFLFTIKPKCRYLWRVIYHQLNNNSENTVRRVFRFLRRPYIFHTIDEEEKKRCGSFFRLSLLLLLCLVVTFTHVLFTRVWIMQENDCCQEKKAFVMVFEMISQ